MFHTLRQGLDLHETKINLESTVLIIYHTRVTFVESFCFLEDNLLTDKLEMN